ncbi:MTH1187 family thiamine-binding protein [Paenibacillus doosanensis]|uniref:MTH1187 family thiamine-binding protein n=1 Tax=Paenibacillus doosanensis TaxID=1229154 RepID=UPI00217F61C2|nr:MTH1187 family thiamine-binding protein [Paenibacillus doosanensis]MCS7465036.1 MTH1187 family thiamine-binding protein [Paenibacillus doosanensis]
MIPIGTATTSLSQYVADIQKVLEQAEEPVHYEMTAMSTMIEGELDDLMTIIRRLHEVPFQHGAQRVSTSIKIDDRRDQQASIQQKLRSVQDKMKL